MTLILEVARENSLPDPLIILLLISNREELCAILGLRDLLNDRRIILILPDDNPDNLAMAHALRPRFITYRDRDLLDVSAVLGRMIALQGRDNPLVPEAGKQQQTETLKKN